jgi:hypothetical protein
MEAKTVLEIKDSPKPSSIRAGELCTRWTE